MKISSTIQKVIASSRFHWEKSTTPYHYYCAGMMKSYSHHTIPMSDYTGVDSIFGSSGDAYLNAVAINKKLAGLPDGSGKADPARGMLLANIQAVKHEK